MKTRSLAARLSLLLSATVIVIFSLSGIALYHSLATQIGVRDDAALLTRIDQIRTLLRDEDALKLIQQKPRLFANMLGNTESLLVLRFPGQPPLIVVNPGQRPVPAITPVAADQPLALSSVHHLAAADGTPFISAAALAPTRDGNGQIEIITGRLMSDRTQTLNSYRNQIILATALAALLVAAISIWLVRRALTPLRRLAAQADAIDARHLSQRMPQQAAAELQPLVAAFNQMLSRLELGYQQLSQVSADMAHDLRTPISTLIGQTEVALSQTRSVGDYQALLGSNYEELERLAKMIDNMLFLAKAEDASQAMDWQNIDLALLGEKLQDYFDGMAEEQSMRLEMALHGELRADSQLLQRALANLMANALRYGDRDSTVRIFNRGSALMVENQGPALSAEQQARIFDRFWRADASRHQGSSGLGLSIVRSIMRLHQGSCEVHSEDGVNRFTLRFPSVRCGH
ncbi:heavy metal sensor histidine kinase [Pantoea sp. DY-15]|uniref:heavy metal sensor histidine kinase n=1 Tax=unclassified Pantoea TaxID=2630326 RepID=UPI001C95A466|nr:MULTISPECIES: heavy metal sensor histidine kinase [unclassified Pantoea]MBY4840215.1 heavy metal sensor histidine kinase [Pantoea sp. DY-5]MBY4888465.1 heavy metal sensor histidine kinase [Pantoea sp. DY-15]